MDSHIRFTSTSPRAGVQAGGPYLRVGPVQNIKDDPDESTYTIGTLWWKVKVETTAGWWNDQQDIAIPWQIKEHFKLCRAGDGTEAQVDTFDSPGAFRPLIMDHNTEKGSAFFPR